MTDLEKAARQALEALELEDMACRYEKDTTPEHISKAITAIKEALAQQQEPVAWMYESTCGQDFATPFEPPIYAKNVRPLYTRPHSQAICEDYSQAAALREALAQQQEPVAWLHNGKLHEVNPIDWATGTVTPLYPSAQFSKPWVNPSIKEYEDIMLANITPRTNDERDGIMGALSDMVVLLQEKNT